MLSSNTVVFVWYSNHIHFRIWLVQLCSEWSLCYFRYKWERNGAYFNPSGNDARIVQLPGQGTIVFNRPEAKDEGIYQCFADNGYGVATTIRVSLREALLSRFAYEPVQVKPLKCDVTMYYYQFYYQEHNFTLMK